MSSGLFGYADFDRVQSWDGPGLDNATHVIAPLDNYHSGALDCSRYQYIAGEVLNATGYAWAKFTFFLDPELSVIVGSFTTPINSGAGIGFVLHIPCLGPFVQVQYTDVSGSTNSITSKLFATNRAGWSPFNLPPGMYIFVPWQVIPASSVAVFNAGVSIAGDVVLTVTSDGPIGFAIQALDVTGNWQSVWSETVNTSSNGAVYRLSVPSGPVRVQINNPGGAPQNAAVSLVTAGTAFP